MNRIATRLLMGALLGLAAQWALAAPGDVLFQDDFERSNPGIVGNGWTVSPANTNSACNGNSSDNIGCAGIDSDTPPWNVATNPRANPSRSMFTRWSSVTVTSPVINLSGRPAVQVTFWVRRGSDCFSEWPGNNPAGCNATLTPYTSLSGEEFAVQYRNDSGAWVTISQFPTDGPPGEIFRPVIDLPADALWSGFQLRFFQPGGSGDSGSAGAPGVRGYDYWHVDDVVLTEQAAVTFTGAFCDTFEGGLSRWSITGNGNAQIGSTYFQNGAHGMDLRWRNVIATLKPTDIGGNQGNITFWVRRGSGNVTQVPNTTGSDKPESGEDLVVEYQTASGNWQNLVTFAGNGTGGQVYCPAVDTNCATPTPATNSFAIPNGARRNAFQLRFRLLNGSGYDMDYWHIDNVCVGAQLLPADLAIDLISPLAGSTTTLVPGQTSTLSYQVTNNGPNPDPGPITVTVTLPTGLNYVSVSSPGWSCSTTAVLTCTRSAGLNSGASDTLTLSVQADITASGSNLANTATVGGQSLDSVTTNNSVTNYYTFGTVLFEAYEPSTAAGSVTGRIFTKLAGTLFNLSVIASNGVSINTAYNRTTTVDLIDGNASCVAATAALAGVTVSPASYTYTGAGAGRDNGLHAFSFTVPEAYRTVKVRIRDDAGAIGCSSDVFAVRPTGFAVSSSSANADGSGASATATPTLKAGAAFSLTATAVNGSLTTLTAYTGTPLIDTAQVQAHAGAVATGTLAGNFTAAVSGVASASAFTYSEVGYFRFGAAGVYDDTFTAVDQATDCTNDFSNTPDASGKYGCKFGNASASAYFGRFIPDRFDTTVVQGCPAGSFTYSAQPFPLTVTARNQAGAVTRNYHGAGALVLAKAVTLSDAAASGAGALAPSNGAASAFVNGVANLTPAYTFTNRQTGATSITVRADESAGGDGVSSSTGAEGSATIRSGRVRLANAYGSELLDLPMTLQAEYWDGLGWVAHAADTCTGDTSLGAANAVSLSLGSASPAGLNSCVLDNGSPGRSGAGCTTAAVAARQFRSGSTLTQGNFNLWLNRTGVSGYLTVTATVPAWLRYNWTGSGDINPTARATFGAYRSPLIYRRENY